MSKIIKKYIGADQVDGSKILLDNNQALRSLDSSAAAQNLLKLNASNNLELLYNPYLPGDPTAALQTATKQYVDNLIPVTQEVRYVAKNGSDVTGTGAINKPYQTITAALNAITDASPTNRYTIVVKAGAYSEAGIALKANVFIVGEGQKEAVRITAPVTMAADFTGSADNRSGFSRVTLLSAANFNWTTVTSAAGKIYCTEVTFGSTVNLYGYNNAIAQCAFDSCVFFGNYTVSGINVGIYTNNVHLPGSNIFINQHPNGGMVTFFLATGGYCAGTITVTSTQNDFSRRCSLFLRSFASENLIVDGPSSYVDFTIDSGSKNGAQVLNGGTLAPMNAVVSQRIVPNVTQAYNMGDWGKEWNWNFAYVHASTGSDCYLISYGSSIAADTVGREVGIYADGLGLNANVNGGSITLGTASVSGTGIRGNVSIDARELDMNNVKIVNLQDPTANQDAATKKYVDDQIGNANTVKFENRQITAPEAAAKQITLTTTPVANQISVAVEGVTQYYGVDYTVSGNTLSWNGLGLDTIGVLANDKFVISYAV